MAYIHVWQIYQKNNRDGIMGIVYKIWIWLLFPSSKGSSFLRSSSSAVYFEAQISSTHNAKILQRREKNSLEYQYWRVEYLFFYIFSSSLTPEKCSATAGNTILLRVYWFFPKLSQSSGLFATILAGKWIVFSGGLTHCLRFPFIYYYAMLLCLDDLKRRANLTLRGYKYNESFR